MRVDLLAVEGVHDIAFIQRILDLFGFTQKKMFGEIPPDISILVPRDFPANKEKDLTKRVDVPHFHVKDDHWIVLLCAGGDSVIVEKVSSSLLTLDNMKVVPTSIGMVLDADNQEPAKQLDRRQTEWATKAKDNELLFAYPFPPSLGISQTGKCPFGIFVMPDNVSVGSIECILLKQAEGVYPVLHEKANAFIQEVKATDGAIPPESELTKEGRHEGKAVLHAMTSVLKPGKTLQASISQRAHLWVPMYTDQFPAHFAPLVVFLKALHNI